MEDIPKPSNSDDNLSDPVAAYTADGNPEAHAVVTWLGSHGIRAHVLEDNSGVSLFAFGTLSQFHKPQVFVDKSDLERASELVEQFETTRDDRRKSQQSDDEDGSPITAECEECGGISEFPASQNGTTQDCPLCGAYMDVGEFDWPDTDFDGTEIEPEAPSTPEDAIDTAVKLDQDGDWEGAIQAYEHIAAKWPEHANYATKCIAEIRRKMDQ